MIPCPRMLYGICVGAGRLGLQKSPLSTFLALWVLLISGGRVKPAEVQVADADAVGGCGVAPAVGDDRG